MEFDPILSRVRNLSPLIHHITNWVTIADCADLVKSLGASPVMAHAIEEVEEMAHLASALVFNIGTLTTDLIESMLRAGRIANERGIPITLDLCGAGATSFRTLKSLELLDQLHIDILKGNASEIAAVAGESVITKGVDAGRVDRDLLILGKQLAKERDLTVVITGKEDIVTNGKENFLIKNGMEMMGRVVGTGCMSTSAVGTFSAVNRNYLQAAVHALVCFEVAGEMVLEKEKTPGNFRGKVIEYLYTLEPEVLRLRGKIEAI